MIKLVFVGTDFILDLMLTAQSRFSISPEELLIRLEEMLQKGEITQKQLKELMS